MALAYRTNMVYTMEFYADGACRGNGRTKAIGSAAAVLKQRNGRDIAWTKFLPSHPSPTNQRAEITAILLSIEHALEKFKKLNTYPYLHVKIMSDSRYVIGCMTKWIYKWTENGWTNAAGNEVANRDLLEEAYNLHCQLGEVGCVEYIWIPRGENRLADGLCNEIMDKQ